MNEGTLWGHLKIFEKKSHSAEKNPNGRPFRHARFCRFPRKSKKGKGGPYALSFLWPDLALGLSSFSSFC